VTVYHGTTRRSARRIRVEGFQPKKPSRRVWFAQSRHYAQQRARHKARRSGDRPVVLTCNVDLEALSARFGRGHVFHRGTVIAIRGSVPASVLRPGSREPDGLSLFLDIPDEPTGLARWVNDLLGLKPHKGVSRRHPGIQRLALWVNNRLAQNQDAQVNEQELLAVACQWLPEYFEGVQVDFQHLRALRVRGSAGEVARAGKTAPDAALEPGVGGGGARQNGDRGVDEDGRQAGDRGVDEAGQIDDPRESEALECLLSPKPQRRTRGLDLLARMEVPDLFEWSMMFVDDEDESVAVAALQALAGCGDINPFLVQDLAAASERRLRAAALQVLALHDDADPGRWVWAGVTDPEPHVRMTLVRHLDRLDPVTHGQVFQAALNDPNPEIARQARRHAEGRGIAKLAW